MYARNIGRLKTRRIAHLLCAFPVLLERHLSNEAHEPLEIDDSSRRRRIQPHWSTWSLGRLDLSVRRRLNRVSNRPLYVCQCVAHELKELYDRKVLTARESLFALDLVNKLSDSIGACERLVTTPVPLNYARHTSRFLTIWCARAAAARGGRARDSAAPKRVGWVVARACRAGSALVSRVPCSGAPPLARARRASDAGSHARTAPRAPRAPSPPWPPGWPGCPVQVPHTPALSRQRARVRARARDGVCGVGAVRHPGACRAAPAMPPSDSRRHGRD